MTLHLSLPEYRTAARRLAELAVNGEKGRPENDPFYQKVTEGRDFGISQKSYSSCGDLAHWLLYRLGVRCAFVNRKENRGWQSGANVSALAFSAPYEVPKADFVAEPGDILIVWNEPHGYDAHVLVVLEHGAIAVKSADYGQPGGALKSRNFSVRGGFPFLGEKRVQRKISLVKALEHASARGELAAPDLSLLGGSTPPPAPYKFVQATNYTAANRKAVDLIVIHTMEAAEKPNTAENVAAWFASANAPKASAHFCVDSDSTVQCVSEEDVAWHAPGANHNGIGIEHAGYAKQTGNEWADEYSTRMLERSAKLCAELCKRWNIPLKRVGPTDLRAGGARGICGHVDVSKAFGKSTHYDPGVSFPWDRYLKLIELELFQFSGEVEEANEKTDPAVPHPKGFP